MQRRKSVVDMVRDKSQALAARLGGEDRLRMQTYYDDIVGLEKRLDGLAKNPSAACAIPKPPAMDPSIGGKLDYVQGDTDLNKIFGACWSEETLRGELMTDVLALALQCNITNVASLLITNGQCQMNTRYITGVTTSVHGTGHYDYPMHEEQAKTDGWHVNMFARLGAKLRDAREIDGSPILDHTAMLLFFEAGYGKQPLVEDKDGARRRTSTRFTVPATGSTRTRWTTWPASTLDAPVVSGPTSTWSSTRTAGGSPTRPGSRSPIPRR